MSPTEWVIFCFRNYINVSGRGGRAEYWWFILACVAAGLAGLLVDTAAAAPILVPLIILGAFVPASTATTRRLHDTDRSGWWQMLALVPLVGWVPVLRWLAGPGTEGPNRFGLAAATGRRESVVRASGI